MLLPSRRVRCSYPVRESKRFSAYRKLEKDKDSRVVGERKVAPETEDCMVVSLINQP